jgi:hypothetical protein
MCYTFAHLSAMTQMKVEDYYQSGKRWWIRLHEKGGKRHEVPAHHNAERTSMPISRRLAFATKKPDRCSAVSTNAASHSATDDPR